MNRFTTSAVTRGLAICGLLAAATLTGCSAGQQAQSAMVEPAVNGTKADINNIALRDVRIIAVQTSDALRPGTTVGLAFVAANRSPDTADSLVGITTDIGQVTVTGNTVVPPSGVLLVGPSEPQEATALAAVQNANAAGAAVPLGKPISNGLTYDFTFRFARAGEATVSVPISAGGEAPAPG